jgi:hypothetical protein
VGSPRAASLPVDARPRAPAADALARAARPVRDDVQRAVERGGDAHLDEVRAALEAVLGERLSPRRFAHVHAEALSFALVLAGAARLGSEPGSGDRRAGELGALLATILRIRERPATAPRLRRSVEALAEAARGVDPRWLLEDDACPGGDGPSEGGAEPAPPFYERFLAAYDPALRREAGVYFTPQPVVDYQVRAVEHALVHELGLAAGYGGEQVTVIDPAAGTGNYLAGVLRRAREALDAAGASRDRADAERVRRVLGSLARRLHGTELLLAPAAVAHARVAALLAGHGVEASPTVVRVGDALRSCPRGEASEVLAVVGNPPYGRIRLGPSRRSWARLATRLDDFKRGVAAAERVNLKNLADLYVLFYRWAFLRLVERDPREPGGRDGGAPGEGRGGAGLASRRGVVCFVTNRSFLDGGAFAGMRAFMRRHFQRIHLVDLGGGSRAGRLAGEEDGNVFGVGTPVAIAICVRDGTGRECEVRYQRLRGARAAKLRALAALPPGEGFVALPGAGGDAFVPRADGAWAAWPRLDELFEHRFSGVQTKRDALVVAVRVERLRRNLERLRELAAPEARRLFHETRDRSLPDAGGIAFDPRAVIRYGYRPLDRRHLYLDERFVEYGRWGSLQACWGDENLALTTLARRHGEGPAAFAQAALPDLHAYRGSFGGYVFPLWDARRREPGRRATNLRRSLVDVLRGAYGRAASPEAVFAYIYAVLQAPAYARRFHAELRQELPRVPFPATVEPFRELAGLGGALLALHCAEPRRSPCGGGAWPRGEPGGADPSRLEGAGTIEEVRYEAARSRVRLGPGLALAHVDPAMWAFAVSGYRVLERWCRARSGLALAPEEVTELLRVARAVRRTVRAGPALDGALAAVLEKPLLAPALLGPS